MKHHKRKTFSDVTKRIIAHNQQYKCVGSVCAGHQLLPQTWEVDHIVPLHLGGSNQMSNLQLLCPNCHALKTQTEARARQIRKQLEQERQSSVVVVESGGGDFSIQSPYFVKGHEKYLEQFRYSPKIVSI